MNLHLARFEEYEGTTNKTMATDDFNSSQAFSDYQAGGLLVSICHVRFFNPKTNLLRCFNMSLPYKSYYVIVHEPILVK